MARRTVKTCDICKREVDRIIGKIQFIPSGNKALTHSNYSHHADVCRDCKDKIFKAFGFRPRMTRKEYLQSRKERQGVPD